VSDRPEDVDAAFAAIVADLEREGVGSKLPDLEDDAEEAESAPPKPQGGPPPAAWRGQEAEWDWSWHTDDEHYVPPEPPPLPPIGPPAIVGLTLLGLGLLLVIAPEWLGVPSDYGLPLGLVGIAAGLSWLILRLWPDPPVPADGSHPDDGAVL